MNERTLFLDRGIGESRGVVLLDGAQGAMADPWTAIGKILLQLLIFRTHRCRNKAEKA